MRGFIPSGRYSHQPPFGTPLDKRHPIARKITGGIAAHLGYNSIEVVTGRRASVCGNPPNIEDAPGGRGSAGGLGAIGDVLSIVDHTRWHGNSTTLTSAAINTTGAQLILATFAIDIRSGTTTFSDSQGNTWTLVRNDARGFVNTATWQCIAPSTSSTHTFTVNGGMFVHAQVTAFKGFPNGASFDAQAIGTSSPPTYSFSFGGTRGELIFIASGYDGAAGSTATVDSGFSIVDQGGLTSSDSYGLMCAWKQTGKSGADTPTVTWSSAASVAGVICRYTDSGNSRLRGWQFDTTTSADLARFGDMTKPVTFEFYFSGHGYNFTNFERGIDFTGFQTGGAGGGWDLEASGSDPVFVSWFSIFNFNQVCAAGALARGTPTMLHVIYDTYTGAGNNVFSYVDGKFEAGWSTNTTQASGTSLKVHCFDTAGNNSGDWPIYFFNAYQGTKLQAHEIARRASRPWEIYRRPGRLILPRPFSTRRPFLWVD